MARRLLEDLLINTKDINEILVYIEDSDGYYISENGNVYCDYGNHKMYPKKNQIKQGYYYCDIKYNGIMKHKRVHILVAQAFVSNPNNYSIVGHKDNNKLNCNKNNLYWTTNQENTQKAVNDNLLKNDIGYSDSQSFPIYVFSLDKKYVTDFGSISQAAKALNISKSTITRQCNRTSKGKSRCGYYFRYQHDYDNTPSVL